MKVEKMDDLLDTYNDYKRLADFFKDLSYEQKAEEVLQEMRRRRAWGQSIIRLSSIFGGASKCIFRYNERINRNKVIQYGNEEEGRMVRNDCASEMEWYKHWVVIKNRMGNTEKLLHQLRMEKGVTVNGEQRRWNEL